MIIKYFQETFSLSFWNFVSNVRLYSFETWPLCATSTSAFTRLRLWLKHIITILWKSGTKLNRFQNIFNL